jgi:hypothetical protein
MRGERSVRIDADDGYNETLTAGRFSVALVWQAGLRVGADRRAAWGSCVMTTSAGPIQAETISDGKIS